MELLLTEDSTECTRILMTTQAKMFVIAPSICMLHTDSSISSQMLRTWLKLPETAFIIQDLALVPGKTETCVFTNTRENVIC